MAALWLRNCSVSSRASSAPESAAQTRISVSSLSRARQQKLLEMSFNHSTLLPALVALNPVSALEKDGLKALI